jgi:hypothetical protein
MMMIYLSLHLHLHLDLGRKEFLVAERYLLDLGRGRVARDEGSRVSMPRPE